MNTLQMQYPEEVIWDLDGTVLDSMGVFRDVLASVLPGHGLTMPDHEAITANYHGTLAEAIDGAVGDIEPGVLERVLADFLRVQEERHDGIDQYLYPDALELMRFF